MAVYIVLYTHAWISDCLFDYVGFPRTFESG